MILVCPSCASSHEIARTALGETGLQVRCPRCRVSWFASVHDMLRQAAPAQADVVHAGWVRRLFHVTATLAGVLAVCGSLMTAIARREAIVQAVPLMEGLYAAIGLPVNPRGLALRNIKGTLLAEGNGHVLAVAGEIVNLRAGTESVPPLQVALRGTDGRDIYTWTAAAPKAKLAAGETVAFRTRLAAPPQGARQVVIHFAAANPPRPEERR